MAISMLTCEKCGNRYHYRSKCPCAGRRGRSGGSGGGTTSRLVVLVAWPLVLLVTAGLVFAAIWWAGSEFGRFRGTIAAAGIFLLIQFIGYSLLLDSWVNDEGDWDPFNQFFSNMVGGVVETVHDLIALRDLHNMERPWAKAILVGGLVGIVVSLATVLSDRPPSAGGFANGTMPAITLPLAGGGEFRTDDLAGATTVVIVRERQGSSVARLDEAWTRMAATGDMPDRMLLVMDQYGDPSPYETGRWFRFEDPIAVGRKWLRESFGDFTGAALVLVVGPDLVVRNVREVRMEPGITDAEADAIVYEAVDRARSGARSR